jgi:hypothetical protein
MTGAVIAAAAVAWSAVLFAAGFTLGTRAVKPPVPGGAPPIAPPTPGRGGAPARPAPAPGPPPPRACPGCGAPRTYTVETWQCDRTHLYDGGGVITACTPCQPDRPDLLDLEIRAFQIRTQEDQ